MYELVRSCFLATHVFKCLPCLFLLPGSALVSAVLYLSHGFWLRLLNASIAVVTMMTHNSRRTNAPAAPVLAMDMFLMEQEVIEVLPLAYMRGRTLNEAFIILDEAQNTTVGQMKMFLTRMGEGQEKVQTTNGRFSR